MKPDQMHSLVAARPFRPFLVETKGGNQIRLDRPEWFYEPPDQLGDFVIFGFGEMHLLNYRDLLDTVLVEQPKAPVDESENLQ